MLSYLLRQLLDDLKAWLKFWLGPPPTLPKVEKLPEPLSLNAMCPVCGWTEGHVLRAVQVQLATNTTEIVAQYKCGRCLGRWHVKTVNVDTDAIWPSEGDRK